MGDVESNKTPDKPVLTSGRIIRRRPYNSHHLQDDGQWQQPRRNHLAVLGSCPSGLAWPGPSAAPQDGNTRSTSFALEAVGATQRSGVTTSADVSVTWLDTDCSSNNVISGAGL